MQETMRIRGLFTGLFLSQAGFGRNRRGGKVEEDVAILETDCAMAE